MTNKKSILWFQIFSSVFTSILGTLLHFTYEWSSGNSLVACFSAVNESTWEHLKLLFFSMFLTTVIGIFYFRENLASFLCAKAFGILTGLLFIPLFFYTYTGLLGTNFAILDIGSFFVAILLSESVFHLILTSNFACDLKISVGILLFLLVCFIMFTFIPPKIELFRDPISNEYGINNNT